MSLNQRKQELEVLRDELLEAGYGVIRPEDAARVRQLLALPTRGYLEHGLAERLDELKRLVGVS